MAKFKEVEVKQISKGENFRANILVRKRATSDAKMSELVLVEVKIFPSIGQEAKMVYLDAGKSWMDMIISYIRDRTLPIDKGQARKLKCQAAKYLLVDGVLYLRGYTLPLLQCLNDEKADYVLRQIHEVICGNHSRARSLAFKALRQG